MSTVDTGLCDLAHEKGVAWLRAGWQEWEDQHGSFGHQPGVR